MTSIPARRFITLAALLSVCAMIALFIPVVSAQEGCPDYSGTGYTPNPNSTGSFDWFAFESVHNADYYSFIFSSGYQQREISECPGVEGGNEIPSAMLIANPESITQGDSSVLSYGSAAVTSCSINQGIGTVSPNQTGTRTVSPASTITYTLSCDGPYGGASDSATVIVTPIPPPAPTATLTATPSTITPGGSSTLNWNSTNANSCVLDQGIGSVTPNVAGSQGVSPGTTVTYTLTCAGANGQQATAYAVVNVNIVASCSVAPTSISTGGSATWTATASGGTGSYAYSWSGTDGLSGTSNPISKAYNTAGTHTASVTVTSGSQSSTVNCANSLAVNTPAQPDLTASNVSGGSATAGVATNLSATISNIGSGGTGIGFNNLFQRATDSNGTNATDVGTGSLGSMGASGSMGAAISHAFPSAGTWYVRACADKSSMGDGGVVAESNEGNNCSPNWVAITVTDPTPTGNLSCSVDSTSVSVGGSVTYTASGGGTPYTWTPSDGVGSYGTGSTAQRTFTGTGSYGMTVSKSGYTSGNCPVVVVGTPACTGATASITASPDRVREGQTSTISWSASGIDGSCTITGPGVNQTISAASCVLPSGQATPTITQQSVYRISCDGGEATDEVVVNLIPEFIEF